MNHIPQPPPSAAPPGSPPPGVFPPGMPGGGFPPAGPPPRRSRAGLFSAIGAALVVVVVAVVIIAGGGDDEPTVGSGSSGGLVTSVSDMRRAAVQLEASGTFREPDENPFEGTGRGSGFLIDPSGIVVTNNHVVAGATSLVAYVGGSPVPLSARILGVSECSDLAVVQIEGGGYPYVEWFEGEALPPLEVYAAGFPLGDPEFTLTRGIVAKARANGDTNWASIEHVIEHDANTQPGNSGGALITADAEVVAVHYAGGSPTNQNQFFAISGSIARPVVEQLRRGEDVDSIGINGRAQQFRTGSLGVWVSAVAADSIASRAGVRPGDVITHLDGQPLAEDNTMSAYCSVLRSRGQSSRMSIRVERWDTNEILEGELNGQPLQVTGPFKDMDTTAPVSPGGDDTATDDTSDGDSGEFDSATPGTQTIDIPEDYVVLFDDTGRITLPVPDYWSDVATGQATFEGGLLPTLTASPDRARAAEFWDVPGVTISILDGQVARFEEIRQRQSPTDCQYERTDQYDNRDLVGVFDVFRNCGGTQTSFYLFTLTDAAETFLVSVSLQFSDSREFQVLGQVLYNLEVR